MPFPAIMAPVGTMMGTQVRQDWMMDPTRHPRRMFRHSLSHIKELSTYEPGMYKMYCRMCEMKQPRKPVKEMRSPPAPKEKVEFKRPAAPTLPALPLHGHLKCQCYQKSLKVLRDIQHSTTPLGRDRTSFVPDKLMTNVWGSYMSNEQTQLPLSTLVVRWQLRRYIPSYDMRELHTILSCFGNITTIYQQSPNSAMVIFDSISSACRAMQTKQLGQLRNKIHCNWWHRLMTNKSVYVSKRGVSVKTDRYQKLLI
ncbi:uncharacterized protein [Haliotis cracherodii]|uniref:uncharacterized protein n=1 Tax=Haliotis cracherodii TaxID=6455 RepID=UPI0039EB1CC3